MVARNREKYKGNCANKTNAGVALAAQAAYHSAGALHLLSGFRSLAVSPPPEKDRRQPPAVFSFS